MRLHVPGLVAGRIEVTGDGFHHLVHVLRVRVGAAVVLFDGSGSEADAVVVAIDHEHVVLEVAPPRAAPAPGTRVTLLLSLLKGERMDLVIQKTTELGVAQIVPVEAQHSVVRLDPARAAARRERWEKIAREAARQCGRADVPEVGTPVAAALAFAAAPAGVRAVLHEGVVEAPLGELLAGGPAEVTVAVGPEGGFAPDELAAARAAGFTVAGLGRRVLRAETAALAAVTIILFAGGDLSL